MELKVQQLHAETSDGWALHLRRTLLPERLRHHTEPLLIVPGYGMNSFIFSYHPHGTSIERCLAEAGYEVWTLTLRGLGQSQPRHAHPGAVSLMHYIHIDLPTALSFVLNHNQTKANRLSLLGASLGGSIAYAHLALAGSEGIGRIVAMGAPLRWVEVHPLIRLAFFSPRLAEAFSISGTRDLVRQSMPLLQRLPPLLGLYLNTATIDMQCIHEMTKTIEDAAPELNREIAEWMRRKDFVIHGINVAEALRQIDIPLKLILANRDGIVPEKTAASVLDCWGGSDIERLDVGDEQNWFAHANLFVANDAPKLVFEPLIDWLDRKS